MFSPEDLKLHQAFLRSVAISLLFYWLWTRRHLYLFALKTPGYWGLPIVGRLYKIRSVDNILLSVHETFQKLNEHTYCVWVGLRPVMITRDPVLADKILASSNLADRAQTMSRATGELLGKGILATEGHKWQKNRKLINPFFRQKILFNFLPAFNQTKDKAIKVLANYQTGKEEWVLPLMQRILLGAAVETFLGEKLRDDSKDLEDYAESSDLCKRELAFKIALSFVKLDFFYTFSKQANEFMKNFVRNRIKAQLKATGADVAPPKLGTMAQFNSTPKNFLDYAIGLYESRQFNEKELFDETQNLLESTYDTTGTTVFTTLLMLAMYPDVQDRVLKELLGVFPEKSFEVTQEHFEQLPYLNMVINESLRVVPPLPLITRRVIRDTQFGDLKLPRDLDVTISLYNLHRSKEIWGPDADSFDPDRFLPENVAKLPPNSFMPFSKGTRSCIGSRYAIYALKVIVAGLVRNYEFKTSCKLEDLRLSLYIGVQFLNKPMLKITARN